MGVVYRATGPRPRPRRGAQGDRARIRSDRDFRDRFKRESQLAASIRHPNVISIYRAGEEDEQLYITMDYVEGTDLTAIIAVRGRLDPKLAARPRRAGGGRGLDAAHARGLVHRDVKPANVLVENRQGDQQAYLTDFGLTKRAKSRSALTKTGMIVGHDRLPGSRADRGRADRRARGRLRPGLRALRSARRARSLSARQQRREDLGAHERAGALRAGVRSRRCPPSSTPWCAARWPRTRNHRFLSAEEMGRAVTAAAAGTAPAAGADVATCRGHQAAGRRRSASAGRCAPRNAAAAGDATAARQARQAKEQACGGRAGATPRRPRRQPGRPRRPRRRTKAGAPAPGPAGRRGAARLRPPAPRDPLAGPSRTPPTAAPNADRRARGRRPGCRGRSAVVLLAGGGGDDKTGVDVLGGCDRPLPAGLAWRAVRNAPVARQYAASTVDGGTVWVFGGIGATTSSPKTLAYDPVIDTWRTGPSLPLPLHHAMAVTYKGDPVVIGGWVPNGSNLTAQDRTGCSPCATGRGRSCPSSTIARAAAAAGVVGRQDRRRRGPGRRQAGRPQTEVFDGISWKDAADIPTPREHLGGASDGRYVYAVGGRGLSADKNSPRWSATTRAATAGPSCRTCRPRAAALAAAVVGGRLITVGGETPTERHQRRPGLRPQEARVVEAACDAHPAPRHRPRRPRRLALRDRRRRRRPATSTPPATPRRSTSARPPARRPDRVGRQVAQRRNAPFARQYAASTAVDGRDLGVRRARG